MNSKKIDTSRKGETRMTKNAGFTLIELMIAIAIFGVVIAGVFGAFWEQLRSHNTQQQILGMQQNARAAMHFITAELRMAGYDPTGTAGAGLTLPDPAVVADARRTTTLSMDIDEDGDTLDDNEQITYTLVNGQIIRTDQGGNSQILADNIDGLDFIYYGVDLVDPTITDAPLNEAEAFANIGNIRFAGLTIIARVAAVPAASYHIEEDNRTYFNMTGAQVLDMSGAPDNFRRIMLRKTIKLRNLGLE